MDARAYRKRCGRCDKLAPEAEMVRISRPIMRWEKVDGVATRRRYPGGWWHKKCAKAEGLRVG